MISAIRLFFNKNSFFFILISTGILGGSAFFAQECYKNYVIKYLHTDTIETIINCMIAMITINFAVMGIFYTKNPSEYNEITFNKMKDITFFSMATFDITMIVYLTAAMVSPVGYVVAFAVISCYFKVLADVVEEVRIDQLKDSRSIKIFEKSGDSSFTSTYIREEHLGRANMRENIKTIKFTATLSISLMLLTYLITLNIENCFFTPNWWWMSNNFALTICGGLFVSFLTILLCELRKYNNNKIDCEALMFQQALGLYLHLYLMHRNVEEYLDNSDAIIPDKFLRYHLQMIQQYIGVIQNMDYITFSKNNILVDGHCSFCKGINQWFAIKQMEGCLNIAICKARMKNLQGNNIIMSKDIAEVLEAICRYIIKFLAQTEQYLETLDKCCDNGFSWAVQKETIEKGYISVFNIDAYKDFLRKSKE